MMKGVGIDIISVRRIREVIERQGKSFLDRVFTPAEQDYCSQYADPAVRYAGRFACKEAVGKGLGCGIGKGVGWHDFEILNDETGRPYLKPGVKLFDSFGAVTMMLSISHCEEYATAIAIWTEEADG